MAYYRSIASGNWSATGTWNQWTGSAWVAATDYPKTGDYVWIQGANIVTYDPTAISVNNSATFAQISNRIDINGAGTIAQPGTGGTNATTGYISLYVASATIIKSTYYSVLSSSNALFTITASSTFTFEGTFQRGTTGGFIKADTGSAGSTINYTGNPIGGTGTSGQCVFLNASISTNIYGSVMGGDGAISYGIYIGAGTQTIYVDESVNGSDVSATGYGIASANTNQHTITVNGDVNSGVTVGAIHSASSSTSGTTGATVTVNGKIRNYGISSGTPTNYFVAIQAQKVIIKQAATLAYLTADGGAKDYTTSGATTVTEASIWAYLTSAATTSGSLGKLIVDNLNAAVADVKASTDRIPTNPASVQSTGDQISALQ